MIRSSTARFSTLLLTCLVLFSSVTTLAHNTNDAACSSTVTKVAKILTVSFLAGCLIRFNTKEADNKPVRYNLDELIAGENIKNNLLYVLEDGLIGQPAKKPFATIDPDTGRISVSTPAYPKGLMGWISCYYKGILTGLGATWFIYTLAETICDPSVNTDNFIAMLAKKIEVQGKAIGFPKWAEAGLPIALGAIGHATLSSSN